MSYNSQVDRYVRDLKSYPSLTKEENIAIFNEYQKTQNPKLMDKLITGNLRLAMLIAKTYHNLFEFETCISIANEALIKAVKVFNPKFGAFSSLLKKCIHNEMLNFKFKNSIIKENYEMVKKDYYTGQTHISTSKVVNDDFQTTVGDNLISDEVSDFEFDEKVEELIWEEVRNECLNSKRRGRLGADKELQPYHIIKGVFAEKPYRSSIYEIAEMYGITAQAVNQSKNTVIDRLKHNQKLKKIWNEQTQFDI